MSSVLKKLLIVVFGLFGLVAVALVVIAVTVDPNDYKDQIQAQVKKQTGRDLLLSGPLELSVFPWLGVQANDVALSNAQGFSDPQMASIQHVEVRLRLLPLLKKQIRLGKVTLAGLVLNLERKADGQSNWDDLTAKAADKPEEPVAEPEDEAAGSLPDLSVEGLALEDARIQWRDSGELTVIDGLNLSTGAIAENEPSNLALHVSVTLADQTKLRLDLDSDWQFALAGPSASLNDFAATVSAQGEAVPGKQQSLTLAMNAAYDGQAQTASLSDGRLEFADQAIELGGQIAGLDSSQDVKAQVEGKSINLAAIAKQLQLELPPQASDWPALSLDLNTQAQLAAGRVPAAKANIQFGELELALDAAVSDMAKQSGGGKLTIQPLDLHAFLASLGYPLGLKTSPGPTSLQADVALTTDSIAIKPIKGQLAGEALSGSASISQFAKPVIRANLDLAGLKVADWAGEGGNEQPASKKPDDDKDSGDLNSMEVPMDWAKDLNLTARVALSRLNAYGVKLRDVRWTADARPGTPVKQELVANAYGGQLALNNSIDANQAEPVVGVNLSAKAIGLGDFLQDGWGSRWITGTTELGMDLTSRGATVGKMRSSANGDARYRLKDGEVKGISLLDLVRKGSELAGRSKPTEEGESTGFTELVGRFLIQSGKLKVKDLGGDSNWFKFAGDGAVDLLAGQYNLRLLPTLLENKTTKNDKTLSKLIGLAIPVDVSGPLTAPKFKIDLEDALKQKAKAEIDKEVDEQKDKLRNKLNEKLGDMLRSQ